MDYEPTDLSENDVVEAVAAYSRTRGWAIEVQATTVDRGFDLVARGPDRTVLRVEAKGATSSKPTSARHGRPFSAAQIHSHVARAFYTAAASRAVSGSPERILSALALPTTAKHEHEVRRIQAALHDLGIGVFWVCAGGVRLEAPWDLPG